MQPRSTTERDESILKKLCLTQALVVLDTPHCSTISPASPTILLPTQQPNLLLSTCSAPPCLAFRLGSSALYSVSNSIASYPTSPLDITLPAIRLGISAPLLILPLNTSLPNLPAQLIWSTRQLNSLGSFRPLIHSSHLGHSIARLTLITRRLNLFGPLRHSSHSAARPTRATRQLSLHGSLAIKK